MKYLLLCFTLISVPAIAQIYQCKTSTGQVFQDKPCAGSKELANKVRKAQSEEQSRKAAYERQQAEYDSRLEPRIGMTSNQAERSKWGYPDTVNKTTTARGAHEQWVYRGAYKSKYLYFENGLLTSIQD
ncbi:DUF4124 domain-containing protein [Acinetobacter ursingii]|uniref:DUF4124 domain-containing protein n=1 Tax=Acinetobacter ursingii TaxID=108980 RepID=UPI00124F7A9E|nr:DUF4124 domain-containing protein [Acinetobacter ursingii]